MQTIDEGHVVPDDVGHWRKEVSDLDHHVNGLVRGLRHRAPVSSSESCVSSSAEAQGCVVIGSAPVGKGTPIAPEQST